jgi:FkbM family methyltransferase
VATAERYALLPAGFHGDVHLLALADHLLARADVLVETGANVGSTLAYVARRYPHLTCISCEPDAEAFARAREHTRDLPNVELHNLPSQELLRLLSTRRDVREGTVVFWLDAHGYGFEWPLREEIAFATTHVRDPLILVDDMLVPGLPCFGYDEYEGQVCSLEYVRGSIGGEVDVFYPRYTERTSPWHPLRGWALLARPGRGAVPEALRPIVSRPERVGQAAPAHELETVRVGFHGFWQGFEPHHFLTRHPYLAERWRLVPSPDPEVVFYSVFPDAAPAPRGDHLRVFYTGENVAPDLDAFDFAISFERLEHERHLRLPNYLPRLYANGFTPEALVRDGSPRDVPDRFCAFLHGRPAPFREQVALRLSHRRRVDAPGDSLRNMPPIGRTVGEKLAFLSQYRFAFAFENASAPGYVTEKIVEAALAGCVPLYWGDPTVADDFDPRAFVSLHDFADEEEFVEHVLALDADRERYAAVRAQPILHGNAVPPHMRPKAALAFFERVFEERPRRKPYSAALAVEGFLAEDECALLYELASAVDRGAIVEIGSYRGRSTAALARGSKDGAGAPVYAIEPHEQFRGVFGGQFGPADRRAFFESMLAADTTDVVRLVNLPCEEAARSWSREIGLLWIDGDHAEDAVRRDFREWEPHVVPGGLVALHDSTSPELGPARIVEEAIGLGWERVREVGITTVLRKPSARYYAQHGEDAVIAAAFSDLPAGFFVEIGCIDGRRFSNTLALEERGWRGICVEAHSGYGDALRRNRPGSAVVQAAAGAEDAAEVDFFANSRGSLSTLDAARGPEFAERYGEWFTGFELQRVPLRTVSAILDELGAPHVDVLSIDVEGTDVDVVRGIDLARHRPTLIVVEADDEKARAALDALLLPAGYVRGFAVATNAFYFADERRLERVRGRRFVVDAVHTAHPLDGGDDEAVRLEVRT